MGDRGDQQGLPQELAEVGRLLRETRAEASALELDEIKLQARARARRSLGRPSDLRRGVDVRSRSVTLILTLLLLGGTTAGGMAWGGGGRDDDDDGAAHAQYKPPKCTKDMRKCECPKGYSLTVKDGQIVCQRNPDGGNGGGHGGHGGHGHHHHHHWRQHHNGHWQWCDGDERNERNWRDWSGRDDDW
jgi:hypothetical protein